MKIIRQKITNLEQIEMFSDNGIPLTGLLYSRAFVEDCDVPLKSKQEQPKIDCFNSGIFTKITPMYVTIPIGSPIYDKDYLQKMDLVNQLKNYEELKGNWKSIIVSTVSECKKKYPDLDYHIIEELGPTTFYFSSGSVEDFAEAAGLHEQASEFDNMFTRYTDILRQYHTKYYVMEVIAQNHCIRTIQNSVIKSHQYLDEKFYDFNKVCNSDKEPLDPQTENLIDEFLRHIEQDINGNGISIFNHMPFHAERLIFLTEDKSITENIL